jgi:uncharacterized membrane protein YvbJ
MVNCTNCGKDIHSNSLKYCTFCSSPQTNNQNSSITAQTKNQRTAVLIALIVGFLGFEGIGHLYIGKSHRGIILLLIGWALSNPQHYFHL